MNQKAETEKAETDTCESAIYRLVECGRKGFITANSYGDGKHYEVVAKFRTLEDMQDYYSALAAIAKVGELESLVQPRCEHDMGKSIVSRRFADGSTRWSKETKCRKCHWVESDGLIKEVSRFYGRCERCDTQAPYSGDTCMTLRMGIDNGVCGGNVQLLPVED